MLPVATVHEQVQTVVVRCFARSLITRQFLAAGRQATHCIIVTEF